jgi:hypothetical protein
MYDALGLGDDALGLGGDAGARNSGLRPCQRPGLSASAGTGIADGGDDGAWRRPQQPLSAVRDWRMAAAALGCARQLDTALVQAAPTAPAATKPGARPETQHTGGSGLDLGRSSWQPALQVGPAHLLLTSC